MENRKIRVSTKHITAGRRNSNYFCPIALALNDKGLDLVFVGRSLVQFNKDHKRWKVWLPKSAIDFIKKFDYEASAAVKPFTFKLNDITEATK